MKALLFVGVDANDQNLLQWAPFHNALLRRLDLLVASKVLRHQDFLRLVLRFRNKQPERNSGRYPAKKLSKREGNNISGTDTSECICEASGDGNGRIGERG